MIIENGAGDGTKARVFTGSNRLAVQSVTRSALGDSIDRAATWNVGTGPITLTTATQSAVMYLKNNGAVTIEIDLYVLLTGPSTGGTGRALISVVRNPTGGTIVTGALPVSDKVQMNFGSNAQPSATIYKGAEGNTLTGFDSEFRSQMGVGPDRLLLPVITQLTEGSSIGVRYTPPAGNTSQSIEVVMELFELS